MVMARARFIKMSFHCRIKDRVEVFMKVVWNGWVPSQREADIGIWKKTMMATGWERFLLSRYSFFIGVSAMYH